MMYVKRLDLTDIFPGASQKSEAVTLRKQQSSLKGEIEQKHSTIRRLVASVEANGGDMPRAIQAQLTGYERRIDELEVELARISNQLQLAETESYRIDQLQDSFTPTLMRLHAGTGYESAEERYALRAKFHDVLKTAIERIDIGDANDRERLDIAAVWKAAPALLYEHPPLDGRLVSAKVYYKNGNTFELYFDLKDAVAQRFTYTAEAIAEMDARGHWCESYRDLGIASYKVLLQRPPTPVRGANGKFARRVAEA